MEIKTGCVVQSCAGRDKGKFLYVCASDDNFVYIADGKERRLESPKKKNPKHLRATSLKIETTALTGNHALRKALNALSVSQQKGMM